MAMRKNPKTGVWEEVEENERAKAFQRGFNNEKKPVDPLLGYDPNDYNDDGSPKEKPSAWKKLKKYFSK